MAATLTWFNFTLIVENPLEKTREVQATPANGIGSKEGDCQC